MSSHPSAAPSSMLAARQAWMFTQSHPLSTDEFVDEARKRGVDLTPELLKALYDSRILAPMFAVHDDEVATKFRPSSTQPAMYGTYGREFAAALADGRLSDPTVTPLPPDWRFDGRRSSDPDGWWNGLLYSRFQMVQLPALKSLIAMMRTTHEGLRPGTLAQDEVLQQTTTRTRTIAVIAAAVEARYVPQLQPYVLNLVNTSEAEWAEFRRDFNARIVASRLNVSARALRNEADRLLAAANTLDPLGDWYHVVKHAAPKYWDSLRGDARLAMDLRTAAEVLLMFSEDIEGAGRTLDPDGHWWTTLHDRLTRRTEPLEEALAEHGIAPGPRAVVILEGQSEVALARRVYEHLGLDANALGIRIISARGTGGLGSDRQGLKPVSRLAAHVLTPVISERLGDSYSTLQPLCAVIVAADPNEIRGGVKQLSASLIHEVMANLADQEIVDVKRGTFEHLLSVTTWREEFEFAHFTTDQITDALRQIHPNCGGLTRDEIRTRLDQCRRSKKNIKTIWKGWEPEPSKVTLAGALWPSLRAAIDRGRDQGGDLPALVTVLMEARNRAVGMTLARYVLPATKPASS